MMRLAVLSLVSCMACLPDIQSLEEAREAFERAPLLETVIVSAPPSMVPVGAMFDDRLGLVGYRMPPSPKRGDAIEIELYWKASRPVGEDYRVFVHGDAQGGGARRIHADHFPAEGRYPTWAWLPGELIVDRFRIAVPRDFGPSRLAIFVGLYSGEYRAPLTSPGLAPSDRENRCRLVELTF